MRNQKGNLLIVVVIVVALLVVGVGAYLLGSKNPTSLLNNQKIDDAQSSQTPKVNSKDDVLNLALISKSGKLSLIDINTGEERVLDAGGELSSNSYQYDYSSAFSPDKKSVLLRKDNNIWKVGTDNKNLKQLSTQGRAETNEYWGVEAGSPEWSPDGKYIHYSVSIAVPGTDAVFPGMKSPTDVKEGVWLMDSEGNNQRFLPKVKYPKGWMPDSKRIIFSEDYQDNASTKTFNIDTENIATLLEGTNISSISWSKDGKKGVYFPSNYSGSSLIDANLKTIDFLQRQRGTIPPDLLNTDYTLEFWESHLMAPNGKYALITRHTRPYTRGNASDNSYDWDHKVEVLLWDTDTKQQAKLPILFSLHTKPFFSQDSKKLVYIRQISIPGSTSVSGERGDIYVYDLDSKQEKRVTNTQDFDPFNIDF